MNISDLDRAARNLKIAGWGLAGALLVISAYSYVTVRAKDALIEKLSRERPITVVPGGQAGVYTVGVSDKHIRNAAAELVALGTNFNYLNAKDRLENLRLFAHPQYISAFALETERTLTEVSAQSQSRFFVPTVGTESLTRGDDGIYVYKVGGDRLFMSGSIEMGRDRGEAQMRFVMGSGDQRNIYGIQFLGFSVQQSAQGGKR